MINSKKYFLTFSSMVLTLTVTFGQQFTKYVNPYIGSADHGHVFVGANVPNGLVQLGPSQIAQTWDKYNGWDWCSGYNYKSEEVLGFTHTHLSGTGIGDLNDLLILPCTGTPKLQAGTINNMSSGYGSRISKKHETVKPGFYSVLLEDYDVFAELTSTERVGYHKYTFNKKENPHILIDLGFQMNWDRTTDTYLKIVNDTTIVGYRFSKGWADDQKLYFAIVSSTPFENVNFYNNKTPILNSHAVKGDNIKAILALNKNTHKMTLKVGLSPVSSANALLNIQQEIKNKDFNATKEKANEKWEDVLSKIEFTASDDLKTIFYTALYHSYFAPTLFNDSNGQYRGTDKEIHQDQKHNNYTIFSLWDTYRALNPLMTILESTKNTDYIVSMLNIFEQQGKLPVWHLWANETNTMVGLPAIPVIADALIKGFIPKDKQELAYIAVKASAMQDKHGLNFVKQLTYIPFDSMSNESVAWALEYAIADYGVYKMATYLNKTEDAEYFKKRYKLYEQYFDKEVGHFVGRDSQGKFRRPFDPLMAKHRENDYCEGNAWQYTWLVNHDIYGLIDLMGGDKKFAQKLDEFINLPSELDDASPDISGMIGQYAQGNEPNHHVPYLYAYVGEQWKTAELVHQAMTKYYIDKPNGLCGNDDAGQMSAWYVFSSLGIYPVNPMDGKYVFGSPLMQSAKITLQNGKTFEIKTKNHKSNNIYIKSVKLNNVNYNKGYITHEELMNGGTLEFEMSDKPNKNFATALNNRP